MKNLVGTLKTLNWQFVIVLMLIGLTLALLAAAALTSDGAMAQTATELAGGPRPMGYGWGG